MSGTRVSSLFADIVEVINTNVLDKTNKYEIYMEFVSLFSDYDSDMLEKCLDIDPIFDEAYAEVFPEQEDGEEDFDE